MFKWLTDLFADKTEASRKVFVIWDRTSDEPLMLGYRETITDWQKKVTGESNTVFIINSNELVTSREWQDIYAEAIGYAGITPLGLFKVMPIISGPNGRVHKMRIIDENKNICDFDIPGDYLEVRFTSGDIENPFYLSTDNSEEETTEEIEV